MSRPNAIPVSSSITVPGTVVVTTTATSTVTHTITSTYQLLCTASPHGENKPLLDTGSSMCTTSSSLTALGLFLGAFIVLFVIVTAGWVWTIVWTTKKKELGEDATLEQAARDVSISCCLRVKENPAYEGQLPAPTNTPTVKLNLRLDCNPAYEGSTFNLDKSTDTQPDSAYELVHYSTERQRLESKAHEYEIPDAMAGGAGSGNTGASVSGEKVGTRERSKSETDDLERTYMVIQS